MDTPVDQDVLDVLQQIGRSGSAEPGGTHGTAETFRQMARDGLVEKKRRAGQRNQYVMTPKGREALRQGSYMDTETVTSQRNDHDPKGLGLRLAAALRKRLGAVVKLVETRGYRLEGGIWKDSATMTPIPGWDGACYLVFQIKAKQDQYRMVVQVQYGEGQYAGYAVADHPRGTLPFRRAKTVRRFYQWMEADLVDWLGHERVKAMAEKFKPGDTVKYSGKFMKSAGMTSDRGLRGTVEQYGGLGADRTGKGFVWVKWNDGSEAQPIKEMALMKAKASFKAAVPGNLADNTKPMDEAEQAKSVDYLKQAGILPKSEKVKDYPVMTANVKRDVIRTLLKAKQPVLANWAARNLTVAAPGKKKA